MDEKEIVPNMMADLYRRIEHNEITKEELSKNVFIIGVPNLELLSYVALKKGIRRFIRQLYSHATMHFLRWMKIRKNNKSLNFIK